MADWVQMTHPTLPDAKPGVVSRQSFDNTWKAIGWKLVKPKKQPADKEA